MSAFIYPTLPGLTLEQVRKYEWKTLLSEADSGVMTTVARRVYPIIHWEHTYEVLRRNASPDELQTIVGLYNAVQGQYDTFLFTDPEFNTITFANMAQYGQFGIGNGTQTVFQLNANFQVSGGPGADEIIQNLNGTPELFINRYGLNEIMVPSPGRTNYLLQSQSFNTTWTLSNATVTANSNSAPDGTVTADALFETTATGTHYASQTITAPSASEQFTFSVFIAPVLTRTWAALVIEENTGSTSAVAYVNLAGGGVLGNVTSGANWSNVSAAITPCNGGFYRCSVTATKTNAATSITAYVQVATGNGTNSYTGNASDGLVLWGAQLEYGNLLATMYLPTTTVAVSETDYTLGSTGLVTFAVTPANLAQLFWAGSWYYRCRFEEDAIVWKKIGFANYWGAQVKFRSVKL